jgi:hypothetical protein
VVKIVSGVLEHLIFELIRKNIEYNMEIFTTKEGSDKTQIIIRIPKNGSYTKGIWIYIYDNPKMLSYYISEGLHNKKRSISKINLLQKIKEME